MTIIQSIQPELGETVAVSWNDDGPEQLSMRQLRHQTKNTLQRLLCQVGACAGLHHDAAGRALALDLERRIHLTAAISDAMFGLTRAPCSLVGRLDPLCRAVVGLMADTDQDIAVEVAVLGHVPAGYDDVLIRVAHELVSNAVKHGMTLRMIGRIKVTVDARDGRLVMTVSDDGWGLCDDGRVPESRGEGLRIAELLAHEVGGAVSLRRDRCRTTATLTIPVVPVKRPQ